MKVPFSAIALTSAFFASVLPAEAERLLPVQNLFFEPVDVKAVEQAFPEASEKVDRFICLTKSDRVEDYDEYNRGLRAIFRKPGEGFYGLNLEESLVASEPILPPWPEMPGTIEEAQRFLLIEEMFEAVEALKFPEDVGANDWCNDKIS